jgi:hypothetical protein
LCYIKVLCVNIGPSACVDTYAHVCVLTLIIFDLISVHAVRSASPVNLNCFLEEMIAVIDTGSHVPRSSPDEERPLFAVSVSGNGTVSVEGLNVDTRTMCAKTVFTLIDFLWRFMREWISACYLTSTQKDDPVYNTVKGMLHLSGCCVEQRGFDC